jgi:hypothetical protein
MVSVLPWSLFLFGPAEPDQQETGYLRAEDREISIDEMLKLGPSIVGYMSKRSVS